MKIYNPTPFDVEIMACSKTYCFRPGEEKDVYNEDHAKVIMKNSAINGLVHLVYNELMEQKYKSFEAFKAAQRLNGLQSVLRFKKEVWINERQAEVDIKHNKGAVADKAIVDPSRFQDQIDLIESEIASISGSKPKKRKLDESAHDASEAAA